MHTRLIKDYGGLVSVMPKYSVVFMVFTLGALGLPGTTGFIGEFLILMGAFKKNFSRNFGKLRSNFKRSIYVVVIM